MTVLALSREVEQGPRPLDVLRDLDGISKLVTLAFAEDMAGDGSNLQHDMALLAATSPFLWALRRISPELRDSFDGVVWMEDGSIVGNVTLTRDDSARSVWTVTNVAVHPSYRRRGIARSLMQIVLGTVDERGGGPVVLEVKPNNTPAYDLYRNLGFHFVDGTTVLRASGPGAAAPSLAPGVQRVAADQWTQLYKLAQAVTSADAQKIRPLRPADYQTSLADRLAESISGLGVLDRRLWLAVRDNGRILSAARVQVRHGGSGRFRLLVHPDGRGDAEEAVVAAAVAVCQAARSQVSATLSDNDQAAKKLLLQHGFAETRRLHRLMIEV